MRRSSARKNVYMRAFQNFWHIQCVKIGRLVVFNFSVSVSDDKMEYSLSYNFRTIVPKFFDKRYSILDISFTKILRQIVQFSISLSGFLSRETR